MAGSLSLLRSEGARGTGREGARSPRGRVTWVPWVNNGPAGRRGPEAALGGPVGAVQPHDGQPALPSLPVVHGHVCHHGHRPLEHIGRCPSSCSSLELLLALETSQALMLIQIRASQPCQPPSFQSSPSVQSDHTWMVSYTPPELGPCSYTPSSLPKNLVCLAFEGAVSWNTSMIE